MCEWLIVEALAVLSWTRLCSWVEAMKAHSGMQLIVVNELADAEAEHMGKHAMALNEDSTADTEHAEAFVLMAVHDFAARANNTLDSGITFGEDMIAAAETQDATDFHASTHDIVDIAADFATAAVRSVVVLSQNPIAYVALLSPQVVPQESCLEEEEEE